MIIIILILFLSGIFTQNSNVFHFFFNEIYKNDLLIQKIPELDVILNETTISGFSSGAYFASQFATSYSSFIKGLALFAGGPYACVKHHPFIVNCLGLIPLQIDNNLLIREAIYQSNMGNIDPIMHVENQRVFIYTSEQDTTITSNVVRKTLQFYETIGDPDKIMFVQRQGEHMFPTDFDAEGHGKCTIPFYPFVANCGYDGAGNSLTHILGTNLNPRNNGHPTGILLKFNQNELHPNPASIGLGENGFLYIPYDCQYKRNRCKLHIVFHGCQMPVSYPLHFNKHFIHNSGYIQWADTNKIILAFPQTVSRILRLVWPPIHPGTVLACWDMFGNYGRNYAIKSGSQILAIRKLIDKIVAK